MSWGWQENDNVARLPLRAMPAQLPDPSSIPPREWLYGTRLIRRFVTVLVAPGGTGKSMYAIGVAMALASGKPILGETVHHRVNSWVLNLEDPLEELHRRVAAMMLRHKIGREELAGRLFLHSGRDRRLMIAQPSPDGYEITYPDKDAMIAAAIEANVGHIVVDPFVKSHGLEENSNPHMDAAATAWAEIGQATGAAIDLIHHTRKGAATDIEAARGGKALTDAARVGQVMTSMSEEEAKELGVPVEERWQHVRLDDAKVNMSPRATKARWLRLEMQELGNQTVDYPHGDKVAAIAVWEPPELWQASTPRELNAALDVIAEGPSPGVLFTASRQGKSSRWAGDVLCDVLSVNDTQAKRMIDAWMKTGLLIKATYHDPSQRKDRTGVRVVDSLRPTE